MSVCLSDGGLEALAFAAALRVTKDNAAVTTTIANPPLTAPATSCLSLSTHELAENKKSKGRVSHLHCPGCSLSYQWNGPRTPRLLSCGHTFCSVCLESWSVAFMLNDKSPSYLIECMVCHESTHVPSMSDCKINFALQPLLLQEDEDGASFASESFLATSSPAFSFLGEDPAKVSVSSTQKADLCGNCEDVAASVFCTDCRASLCTTCELTLHSSKLFRSHKVAPLASSHAHALPELTLPTATLPPSVVSQVATKEAPRCPVHKNRTMDLFCLTEKVLICDYCRDYGQHAGHSINLVQNLVEEERHLLQSLAAHLHELSEQQKSATAQLEQVRQKVEERRVVVAAEIEALKVELMAEVNRHITRVQQEAKLVLQRKLERIEGVALELSALEKSTKTQLKQIDSTALLQDHELVGKATAVQQEVQSLSEQVTQVAIKADMPCELKFQRRDAPVREALQDLGSVGAKWTLKNADVKLIHDFPALLDVSVVFDMKYVNKGCHFEVEFGQAKTGNQAECKTRQLLSAPGSPNVFILPTDIPYDAFLVIHCRVISDEGLSSWSSLTMDSNRAFAGSSSSAQNNRFAVGPAVLLHKTRRPPPMIAPPVVSPPKVHKLH